MNKTLKILMIASECSGFVKVGGLGDVVHDLSVELQKIQGNKVSVIIPYYETMDIEPDYIDTVEVEFDSSRYKAGLYLIIKNGVRYYFIRNHLFFGGKYKTTYIDSFKKRKGPFEDDAKRFAFFSKVVLTLIDKHEDFLDINILHCHDWHTGFIFPFLKYDENYKKSASRIKTVFTIHNLNYQGIRPYQMEKDERKFTSFRSWFGELFEKIREEEFYDLISYPADLHKIPAADFLRLQHSWKISAETKVLFKNNYKISSDTHFYELTAVLTEDLKSCLYEALLQCSILCFNPIRAGINFADKLNTVSKTYSIEITNPDDYKNHLYRGCGLEDDLKSVFQNGKLEGIVNGISYEQYDPEHLDNGFSAERDDCLIRKEEHKQDLLCNMTDILQSVRKKIGHRFKNYSTVMRHIKEIDWDRWKNKPLFVSIGRATDQKLGILFEEYEFGDKVIEEIMGRDGFFLFIGSGEFEKRLDSLNKIPNALYLNAFEYELGLRVYSSGDVFLMPSYYEPCGISQLIAMRYGTLPLVNDVGGLRDTVVDSVTGFKYSYSDEFDHKTGLVKAVDRVISCYNGNREQFGQMQLNAMKVKFGWTRSALEYLDLYIK